MGAINENSVRQQIIGLDVGSTATFPIERAEYISSVTYRIAKRFKRKFTCPTTADQIKVTRVH